MDSLVVPSLDTLRQWLDEMGMSFFECDTCQALHLPHMQNFEGVFIRAAGAGGRSLRYQRQFADGEGVSRYAG